MTGSVFVILGRLFSTRNSNTIFTLSLLPSGIENKLLYYAAHRRRADPFVRECVCVIPSSY